MTARRASWLAGAAIFAVYLGTLAPDVTFWDAGEFIAAAHALGIPHPPGTPLFVIVLKAWATLLGLLPFALATNLFSAVCGAVAVGFTARWLLRDGPTTWVAVAAVTAGAMTSVWLNATETEVYSASLALAIATIVVADLAGRKTDPRDRRRLLVLASYLIALAAALHVSALVAAPVAILLAVDREDGTRDWNALLVLGGVAVAAMGVSRLSAGMVLIGLSCLLVAAVRSRALRPSAMAAAVVSVIAMSAIAFLLVRARHDPAINQGNPTTWSQVAYVVGRQQYDLPGMWPRRAPLWIQLANWFEYADWQFALSLGPSVVPTIPRMLVTAIFAALGVFGAQWQRAYDRRTWRATVLLFACGSVGILAYLNLKAGASFAWNFVPDSLAHEARERDYFFCLGFWAWGVWAGLGAIRLAKRLNFASTMGATVALLPIVLNWRAVDRRSEPDASMPRLVASSLLENLPARAVLFVAGDNDTYPLWYLQRVHGVRRDVTVVTMPLVAAPWYLEELRRRDGLAWSGSSYTISGRSASLAAAARRLGRPIAVALTVPVADRVQLGGPWTVIGATAVEAAVSNPSETPKEVIRVDSVRTRAMAGQIDAVLQGRSTKPAVDPVHDYFLRVLSCPRFALGNAPSNAQLASLDSTCNLR